MYWGTPMFGNVTVMEGPTILTGASRGQYRGGSDKIWGQK